MYRLGFKRSCSGGRICEVHYSDNGDKRLCEVSYSDNDDGWHLKQKIAASVGTCICMCKLRLFVGDSEVRYGLKVRRWADRIPQGGLVVLIVRDIVATGTNAAKLHEEGMCFKCLNDAGVEASEILSSSLFGGCCRIATCRV